MTGNTTKATDLRGRTGEELLEFVREKENELLRLRFQRATGQLENIRRVSQVKREIARARTISREKAAAAK